MVHAIMGVFLAVAGNIGSGKTTLTRRLVDRLSFQGLFEGVESNPYLEDFYADMPRYSLPLQLTFLAHRVRDTRRVQSGQESAVQDRTCYEDAYIFAANLRDRGAMDERDFGTYQLLSRELLQGIEPPNLLVYLRRSVESCRTQIQKRGREYEQSLPPNYLADLHDRYERWYEEYDLGKKVMVDAAEYDFLNSESDLDQLVRQIRNEMPQPMLPFFP